MIKKISESVSKTKEDDKDSESLSEDEKSDLQIDIIDKKKESFINEEGTLSGTISRKHKV